MTSGRLRLRRGVLVVAALALAAAIGALTQSTWAQAEATTLLGRTTEVRVKGSDLVPAVSALALLSGAAAVAATITGRFGRRTAGSALVLAGLAVAGLSVRAFVDPAAVAADPVAAATGVAGAATSVTALWPPLLEAALGLATALAGAALWRVPDPPSSRRFERVPPSSARPGSPTPDSSDPDSPDPGSPSRDDVPDPAADWDVLSRGEDPTR